jgi:hypothetical protein
MTKHRLGILLVPGILIMVAACGSGGGSAPAAVFHPEGGASGNAADASASSGSASGAGSVIMPPFGKNLHVVVTSQLPANPSYAQAMITDEDFEFAVLYAEYKGGQDQGWASYADTAMQTEVTSFLSQSSITTESFIGTISYSHFTVIPDPQVKGDLDVSGCLDNSKSSNTNIRTGAVLPDTTPPDQHYVLYTDELRRGAGGQWQVVSTLAPIYYPRAKECKP